jgi:hypothetical protein
LVVVAASHACALHYMTSLTWACKAVVKRLIQVRGILQQHMQCAQLFAVVVWGLEQQQWSDSKEHVNRCSGMDTCSVL